MWDRAECSCQTPEQTWTLFFLVVHSVDHSGSGPLSSQQRLLCTVLWTESSEQIHSVWLKTFAFLYLTCWCTEGADVNSLQQKKLCYNNVTQWQERFINTMIRSPWLWLAGIHTFKSCLWIAQTSIHPKFECIVSAKLLNVNTEHICKTIHPCYLFFSTQAN